jgi:hypothetical protein
VTQGMKTLFGRHKHERRIGGAAMIRGTLVAVLAVFAVVFVAGCGPGAKRSDSQTAAPSRTGLIGINPQFS